jgi:hypothetical protein
MPPLRKAESSSFPGGIRRLWPGLPYTLPSGRDPSLVREVLLRGGDRIVDAARNIGSWVHLMALCESGWLGPPRSSARMSLRETGERMVSVAARRRSVASLFGCSRGEIAFVSGTVAHLSEPTATAEALLWHTKQVEVTDEEFFGSEDPWPMYGDAVYLETARDFVLSDAAFPAEPGVIVRVDGAYLVGSRVLTAGLQVGVLGFVDEVPDPLGRRRSPRDQPARSILRSGPNPPLLVLAWEDAASEKASKTAAPEEDAV